MKEEVFFNFGSSSKNEDIFFFSKLITKQINIFLYLKITKKEKEKEKDYLNNLFLFNFVSRESKKFYLFFKTISLALITMKTSRKERQESC